MQSLALSASRTKPLDDWVTGRLVPVAPASQMLVGTPMPLKPEIEQYLADNAKLSAPNVWEAPVDVLRAGTYARAEISGVPEKIFSVEDRYIPGPTCDLHVRIYRPKNGENLPALVYFHGGGWVLHFLDNFDAALHSLANRTGSVIIAVNYQKAPEHPYPTPFNDCYATLLWVHANAKLLGIDPSKIGVGGDSAGANLASAVALKARDSAGPKIAYQLLFYPCNARDFETDSYLNCSTGYGLSRQGMQWFWEQYLQGSEHDNDPYACPLTASDFSNLAPTIVITAEFDPLKDDGIKYERLLREAGVETHYKEYEGMIHGFVNMGEITPTAKVAISDCAALIRKIVS